VSDELWAETTSHFSGWEFVELLSLQVCEITGMSRRTKRSMIANTREQGFYYTISWLGTVLEVDIDDFVIAKSRL
jgi:hypothetical protein